MSETPENSGELQEIRDEKGKFVKGVSGNPMGKPIGAKNKISVIGTIEDMFENNPTKYQEFIDKYLADPRNRQHIVDKIDGKPEGSGTNLNIAIQNNYSQQDREEFESYDKIVELAIKKYGDISNAITNLTKE